MEKLDMTLGTLINDAMLPPSLEYFQQILKDIKNIFRDLRKMGRKVGSFSHGDLHMENILLSQITCSHAIASSQISPKRFKIRIIDFGFSEENKHKNLELEVEVLILAIKSLFITKTFDDPPSPQESLKILKFIESM
jgi:serine/threonine protein kinase